MEEGEPGDKAEALEWTKDGIISTEIVSAKMAKQGGRQEGQQRRSTGLSEWFFFFYKHIILRNTFFFFKYLFYLFIYLFIYGCVGSSFLCEGFL